MRARDSVKAFFELWEQKMSVLENISRYLRCLRVHSNDSWWGVHGTTHTSSRRDTPAYWGIDRLSFLFEQPPRGEPCALVGCRYLYLLLESDLATQKSVTN